MVKDKARTALIISGGAPNATLVAGALTAFHKEGLEFDVVSTAGAGALLGLMYYAPRNGDPTATLKGVIDLGVADPLYEAFPVNFKVFNKPGALADMYRRMLAANPFTHHLATMAAPNADSQFFKDSLSLMFATACPSDLNTNSLGLCAHVPFAEEVIDFDKVATIAPHFLVNAYNLSTREMENFDQQSLTPLHLQAALSFPFLYPPTQIGDGFYIEGAALDCLNFQNLLEEHPDLEEIVVFDILGAERLLRAPRNLYDAWVMSIITPLIEIARDDLKIFESRYRQQYPSLEHLHKLPLIEGIPDDDLPDVFDWSRSNLQRLFDIGYRCAVDYIRSDLGHLRQPAGAGSGTASKAGREYA
jgi:NTE family protein